MCHTLYIFPDSRLVIKYCFGSIFYLKYKAKLTTYSLFLKSCEIVIYRVYAHELTIAIWSSLCWSRDISKTPSFSVAKPIE